ncbi:hypothetical protein IGI04_017588 [Brassica rapa subsp. trilocularis]|uniref:Ubiquitin-like protease family profile domain-containing protein n=2 Tax=Brassica rapa subsp. trilocularis TaxID=1813537 RepID=A0ABQ7MDX8_BRACM|nr:hypothetical protein IGI04_017588 [Brassica rapa subsp. trilocularis]
MIPSRVAVPSLTEVVQESCSSSESDSDEDDVDGVGSKTKKKTLSPAHAREVDKKEEVLVRSILPQDPARPVDESVLVWADEVVDVKVAYMLSCINANQVFTKDMFRGGVTKADVERMRELAKAGGRKKTLPTQGKESPVVMNDERRITSIVNAIMRPELNRIDGDIATVVASVKEVSGCSLAIEAKVIATVERMLDSFKTEIMSGRRRLNTQSSFESPISTGGPDGVGDEEVLPNTTAAAPAGNDEIIENVIENLSHYSTPPGVDNDWPGSDGKSRPQTGVNQVASTQEENTERNVTVTAQSLKSKPVAPYRAYDGATDPHQRNPCSEGIVEESNENHPCRSAHSQTHEHPDPIIPSFSLGLTQEFHQTRELGDDVMGENEEHLVEKDNGDDTRETEENLLCRKSKRIRTVPPQLLTDYQCEAAIINRAREVPIMGNGHYGLSDVHDKYKRLQILLKKECVINVLGLSVSGKDITDIGGRTRLLPGRVVDIIMRVIAASVNRRLCEGSSRTPVFLDSRVQVLLSRNFTKFRKSKRESQYVFTQALVDTLQKSLNFNPAVSLFYMPVSIGRQHWVGICVDISTAKVYVLDCNPQVIDDKALSKELAPITEMFPSLLKHCGLLVEYGNNAFVVERVKGVVKNPNPSDAAITSCLLMQTHALSGPETCRSITPSLIPDEAQTAAVMLVIVEAVPSLTEVVQESCSSSESDSDEDDVDGVGSKTKKKTLSPAHAREVDKKEEVLVRSILPQDPARPVDESVLVWADEVVDVKVAYMLSCINANQVFTKDMFRGGVTKADVERMRELAKAGGRKKTLPTQGKESPVVMNDERRITSIVNAIMRPELNRIDGDIATVVASVKEVSGCSLAIEAKVIATVERMLDSFKTEIMSGRRRLNTQSSFESPISTGGPDGVGDEEVLPNTTAAAPAGNDEIIENVIENLSHYSTPPGVDNDWPGSDGKSRPQTGVNQVASTQEENTERNVTVTAQSLKSKPVAPYRAYDGATDPHQRNPCSEGIVEESNENHPCRSAHSQTHEHPDPIIPSFSLGLTQEFHQTRELGDDVMGENEEHLVEKDNGDDTRETEENLLCRKSKRIRTVPPQLLTDYQCEAAIINRAREVPIMGNGHYGLSDVHDKYKRLQILLKKECVINVLGLSVSGKDITDIGGRTRLLPGRVVDIIMRVIAASVNRRLCEGSSRTPVFLDSRVQVLLSRNFTKFRKSKRESQYVFTQALVDTLQKSLNFNPAVSLFYMPVSIGRQHWVGICVDISTAKVYVLDCNPQVIDDKALSKELAPITEMFPSLLKHCGLLVEYGNNAFVVERVKGVVKNPNPSDAAITSCLLMQTHALSGPETCRSITPSLIPDEAQTAAVMVYEFNKKI